MMSFQELACPRCDVPRTFRLWRGRSLCANCKHQFHIDAGIPIAHRTLPCAEARSASELSALEIARLIAYRPAVAHGVYSDYPI
jgi:hypothetical protein